MAPINAENIVPTNTVLIACAKEKHVPPTMMSPKKPQRPLVRAAEGAAKK
jgi:hypothetical protein